MKGPAGGTDTSPASLPRQGPAPDLLTGSIARVARGAAASAIGVAAAAVLNVLVVLIVARAYPAAEAGSLFAATSMFLIVVAVAELGVDTGLLHWLPRYHVSGATRDARECLRVALVPVIGMSLVCTVLLAAFSNALGQVDASGGAAGAAMVQVLAPFIPLAAITDLLLAVTRAYRSMRATVLVDKIGRSFVQLLAVGAAAQLGVGGRGLAFAWALAYLPSAAAATVAAARLGAFRRSPVEVAGAGERSRIARSFWRYTLPRSVARVLQVALQRADIVLVAAIRSPAEAAVYTAATRFLVLGLLAVQSVQQVTQPHLSHALARGEVDLARRLFVVATTWIVIVAWPPYLLMIGYGSVALRVVGKGYTAGFPVIVMLAVAMLFAAMCGPVDVVLTMAGRSGLSLANTAAALGLDLLLDVLLIPSLGMRGAAIGWAAATVLRNALPLVQVQRILGIRAGGTPLYASAAAAVLCCWAIPAAGRLLHVGVVGALLAIASYAAFLWASRRTTQLDVAWAAITKHRRASVRLVGAA